MKAPQARNYTVSQYNRAISLRLAEVPPVWVQGSITQLRKRDPMAYLTLAEFQPGQERPTAVLELCCWTKELRSIEERLAQLPRPLALAVDLKVSLLIQAEFYTPWGKFQPKILDVDPEFSMGELALTREQTLRRLRQEGLLDLNKELELPTPTLRIGLITAPRSAAYADFCDVLDHSPFRFEIHTAWAKMQGDSCAESVLQALDQLRTQDLDVVCIVRGGGSKTDLVYFDNEELCRSIATFPIPVLTGIGHQIDVSLADMVAYENRITPTDCARFLVAEAQMIWEKLQLQTELLHRKMENRLSEEAWRNERQAEKLERICQRRFEKEHLLLSQYVQNLHFKTQRQFEKAESALQFAQTAIRLQDPKRLLHRGWARLIDPQTGARPNWEQLQPEQDLTLQISEGLVDVTVVQRHPKADAAT